MRKSLIAIAVALAVLAGAGAGSTSAQSAEPRFVLSGVVFVEGGTGGRAWLLEPTLTQNQVITVRPGDSIGPYRLASIHDDRVELQGPSGKLVVPLAGVSGPVTAAGPTPAPITRTPNFPAAAPPREGEPVPFFPLDPNRKKVDFRSLFEGLGQGLGK